MRASINTLVALALLVSLQSCSNRDTAQRDLVLETADSFEEIVDKNLADGRKVFGKYCSICHGVEGKGDGFNAYNLNPKPRDFTDSSYRDRMDSTQIIETISSGGAAMGFSYQMPAWGRTMTKTDIEKACYYTMYLSKVGAQ